MGRGHEMIPKLNWAFFSIWLGTKNTQQPVEVVSLLFQKTHIHLFGWYCWWKNSCTTRYLWHPVKNGIFWYSPYQLVGRMSSIKSPTVTAINKGETVCKLVEQLWSGFGILTIQDSSQHLTSWWWQMHSWMCENERRGSVETTINL